MLDAKLSIPRFAHAVLGCGPPILMYPISAHETRILVDIPDLVYNKLGNSTAVKSYLRECVVPIVPKGAQRELSAAIKKGRLRSMPSAWMPSTKQTTPGLIIIGDALNMRHPVTGAGMTVAFKDTVLLANLLNPVDVPNLEDASRVLARMRNFHWRRKEFSASLNILAQALYLLFVSENPTLQIMQLGFIRYVQEGEKKFAEPAWIMGGVALKQAPWRLFHHFFAVAIFSVKLHLQQAGCWGFLPALYQSAAVLVAAIRIIWGPLVHELRG